MCSCDLMGHGFSCSVINAITRHHSEIKILFENMTIVYDISNLSSGCLYLVVRVDCLF